jgi:hypothetical protein
MLTPSGLFDLTSKRVSVHSGHAVRVCQPYGCPRNGTMDMIYVDCEQCSKFIGLVNLTSLSRKVK